jgi:Na+-translocating ferredoxin:NAD+ oxidoreductase RnfD subunit
MSEALRTFLVAAIALGAGFSFQSLRTAAIPHSSPERLVAELRLAQVAALILTLIAGAYLGLAAGQEARIGVGLDIAFAAGFFVLCAYTLTCDPRQALTLLALGFAAHAILDIAHRPGVLPDALAPWWYTVGGATFDVILGALCYFPILRRPE